MPSVADGASQVAGVVGEVAGLVAVVFRVGRAGVEFAQLVVDVSVGGHRGADVDADGRGVDEFHVLDAFRENVGDVVGHPFPSGQRLQRGHEAFQNQRRLAGSGDARHYGEPPFGNIDLQRLYGVYLFG